MARCSNCKGPLAPGSVLCEYCGNRTDIDLSGINYFTTHENDTPRCCPRCNITLKTIDIKLKSRFLVERCDECLGLFFDPGELEALLEAMVSNVFSIDRSGLDAINAGRRPNQYAISYIKCPVCSNLMNRINFGIKSGVIVDRCKEHGVWLDSGELRRLLEWMKLGGQLLDQQRQEQARKEELRKIEHEHQTRPDVSGTPTVFDYYSESLRSSDPELFQIIFKAINHLFH